MSAYDVRAILLGGVPIICIATAPKVDILSVIEKVVIDKIVGARVDSNASARRAANLIVSESVVGDGIVLGIVIE